ncbi:hypothetical protein [Verminephrobacter eiseniae]|uniref:hypothetical protein n=1 Tax=Verminephrobacter eiseniae TaxID=364317 RepID=UPI002237A9AE|nr:hypothetical protein [Verminephrobacter eiseniae]MCW5231829.1 hypothetical protein [Verminephrobacter eiseniae]MCW5293563.1 hypothetical protein [Verminephrobacter eiseniae]MCW8186143.1 hypothetical protein [Verminephrobacter eiseniae]MCW8224616.1 hypothetical protein [Verminephrobacter eiseniae]MCW8233234.1 hypothetical protein [Verminephrobacter eiseniae]
MSRHRSSVGLRWPSKRIAALHRLPIRSVLAARSLRHLIGDATLALAAVPAGAARTSDRWHQHESRQVVDRNALGRRHGRCGAVCQLGCDPAVGSGGRKTGCARRHAPDLPGGHRGQRCGPADAGCGAAACRV